MQTQIDLQQLSKKKKMRIEEHPFFGMLKAEKNAVNGQLRKLRGARFAAGRNPS